MDLTAEIKSYALSCGASLAGVAELEPFRNRLPVVPHDLLDPYSYALSLAIRLDDSLLAGVDGGPTPDYSRHCLAVNDELNTIAGQVAQWILAKGYAAVPIPASQKVDDAGLLGNISHKAVARMAGLGWQGKSLLLVTPQYGPGVRLVTILTTMPLVADRPLKNRCGGCRECAKACPASAIKGVSTDSHYEDREVAIDLDKCHGKLLEFKNLPGIGYTFCGVCIKVCPFRKARGAPS